MSPKDYVKRLGQKRTFAGWVVAHPDTLRLMRTALTEADIRGYPDSSMAPGKVMVGHKGPEHEEGY